MKRLRELSILFYEMFTLSLFVVGGGYAIIAVADEVFSKKRHWTREGELLDQLSLFQMVPGILAGHMAVYVGRRVAGFVGSLVALLAIVLPSILIFSLVSMGYDAIPVEHPILSAFFVGLRASFVGILAAMICRGWGKSAKSWRARALAVFAGVALLCGANVLLVLALAILLGLARAWFAREKGKTLVSFSFAPLLFLQYGLVALGGGYVLVPFYLRDFVGAHAPYLQISSHEFANLMALTQMTPGPIGINAATFFGYRLGGWGGAFLTSFCLLLPGFIILSLALLSLERFRENKYVKSVVATVRPITLAMMFIALVSFAQMTLWTTHETGLVFHPIAWILASGAWIAIIFRVVPIVRLILLAGGLSVLLDCLERFF